MQCPDCKHIGNTKLMTKTCTPVMVGGALLLTLCGIPCIALFVEKWKGIVHLCSNCGRKVGQNDPKFCWVLSVDYDII